MKLRRPTLLLVLLFLLLLIGLNIHRPEKLSTFYDSYTREYSSTTLAQPPNNETVQLLTPSFGYPLDHTRDHNTNETVALIGKDGLVNATTPSTASTTSFAVPELASSSPSSGTEASLLPTPTPSPTPRLVDTLFIVTNACLVETARKTFYARMELILHQDSIINAIPRPISIPNTFHYPYFVQPSFRDISISLRNATNTTYTKDRLQSAFVVEGRTLLASYNGQVQNTFHAHNDILLSLWRKQRISQSLNLLVLGYHQDHEQPWFHAVLEKTFVGSRLVWKDLQPQSLCFDELVLYERADEGLHRSSPFYEGYGRFNRLYSRNFFQEYRHFISQKFATASLHAKRLKASSTVQPTHTKPVLTWISRGTKGPRTISNEEEILTAFQKYFRTQIIRFDSNENNKTVTNNSTNSSDSNSQEFEYLLTVLSQTNILMGLHGAGLTNAIYLPDNNSSIESSMLVELVHIFGREKKLFVNVANKLDLPYYAFDLRPFSPASNTSIHLDLNVTTLLVEQLWDRWQTQQTLYRNETWAKAAARGECDFPRLLPRGELTPVQLSYCYLTDCNFVSSLNSNLTRKWMQVQKYGSCPMGQLKELLKHYAEVSS